AALGGSNHFEHFLEPVFATESVTAEAGGKVPAVSEKAEKAGTREAETAATLPKPEGKQEKHEAIEYLLMGASLMLGFIGWFGASYYYKKCEKGYCEPLAAAAPPVYATLLN